MQNEKDIKLSQFSCPKLDYDVRYFASSFFFFFFSHKLQLTTIASFVVIAVRRNIHEDKTFRCLESTRRGVFYISNNVVISQMYDEGIELVGSFCGVEYLIIKIEYFLVYVKLLKYEDWLIYEVVMVTIHTGSILLQKFIFYIYQKLPYSHCSSYLWIL